MAETAAASDALSPATIVGRIERIPFTRWHVKARIVCGTATMFDAYDSLSIAYVLPVLLPQWRIARGQVGLLIAASSAG